MECAVGPGTHDSLLILRTGVGNSGARRRTARGAIGDGVRGGHGGHNPKWRWTVIHSRAISRYWMAKRLQRLGMPMDKTALRQMPHGLIVRPQLGYDGTYVFGKRSLETGAVAEVLIVC